MHAQISASATVKGGSGGIAAGKLDNGTYLVTFPRSVTGCVVTATDNGLDIPLIGLVFPHVMKVEPGSTVDAGLDTQVKVTAFGAVFDQDASTIPPAENTNFHVVAICNG